MVGPVLVAGPTVCVMPRSGSRCLVDLKQPGFRLKVAVRGHLPLGNRVLHPCPPFALT